MSLNDQETEGYPVFEGGGGGGETSTQAKPIQKKIKVSGGY